MSVFAEMVGIAYLKELHRSQQLTPFDVANRAGEGYDSLRFMAKFASKTSGCYMATTADPNKRRSLISGPMQIARTVAFAGSCTFVSLHGDRTFSEQLVNIVKKSKLAKRTNIRCSICKHYSANAKANEVHVLAAHKLVGCYCITCEKTGSFSEIVNHLTQKKICVPFDKRQRPTGTHSYVFYRSCVNIPTKVEKYYSELVQVLDSPATITVDIEANMQCYNKDVHKMSVKNINTTRLLCHRGDGGNCLSDTLILWYYYDNWLLFKLERVDCSKCKSQHHYVCTNEYVYTWTFDVDTEFMQFPAQVCTVKRVSEPTTRGIDIPRFKGEKYFHLLYVDGSETKLSNTYNSEFLQFPDYIVNIE